MFLLCPLLPTSIISSERRADFEVNQESSFEEKKNVSGEGAEGPGALHPFLSTLTADQSSGELQY